MRLAVTLHLCDFVEPLPLRAGFGIRAINFLAHARLDDWEHTSAAQVAVVRDCQHVAAGLLLVAGHPLPQVARVVAAQRWNGGERQDLAGPGCVVPEDDVAMKVVAAGHRGPLIADERREAPWVVRLLRRLDDLLPQ